MQEIADWLKTLPAQTRIEVGAAPAASEKPKIKINKSG